MVKRFWLWLWGEDERPAENPLARLYILHVDFPLSDPAVKLKLEENLDALRRTYGIDFFVLEPGLKLTRFDAI